MTPFAAPSKRGILAPRPHVSKSKSVAPVWFLNVLYLHRAHSIPYDDLTGHLYLVPFLRTSDATSLFSSLTVRAKQSYSHCKFCKCAATWYVNAFAIGSVFSDKLTGYDTQAIGNYVHSQCSTQTMLLAGMILSLLHDIDQASIDVQKVSTVDHCFRTFSKNNSMRLMSNQSSKS